MGKFQNNQSGFSAVEGLLFLVIVAIVGGTGWYVYNANMKTNSTYSTASQNSQSTTTFKKRAISSTATKANTHSSDEAVTFTQKTYNDFLAAINNAGTNNTQPLGLVGLAAVKTNLTAEMYAKAAASHNGAAFSCAAQFVPNKYTASFTSADKTSATVAMTISNSSDGSTSTSGMNVNVNLASLKITAVNCPN